MTRAGHTDAEPSSFVRYSASAFGALMIGVAASTTDDWLCRQIGRNANT